MSIIQAVLFNKDYFSTTRKCREWLNEAEIDNYIKPALVSEKYIQYKLVEPKPYYDKGYKFKLRNIDLGSGIQLVMLEKPTEKRIKYLHTNNALTGVI